MDPQFLSSALANATGGLAAGLAVAIVCLASRKLCRAIVRRRTSMLPKGDDADRAAEELDGWAIDLTAAERIDLAGQLLLQAAELSEEIEQRVARTAKPQLTRREMEILQLLAQGWTSAEIATKVLLQPGTVSVYIQVLQRKLGLSDPAQLPLWALRRGIGI